MNRAMSVNKLKPVIDRAFEYDELLEAFRHMETASHFGKIVIKIDN